MLIKPPRKYPTRKNSPESQLQQACVKWFRLSYPTHVLFSIPNEGKRALSTASRMKAEGLLAGAADLFLALPKKTHHGLFIEMKRHNTFQTDKQKKFQYDVTKLGYLYYICKSFDEFQRLIESYINEN